MVKGEQSPFYLEQCLLEFSHRNIEDVDLCHERSIGSECRNSFCHVLRAFVLVSLSILAMVRCTLEFVFLSSRHVSRIRNSMCRVVPKVIQMAVFIFSTVFCADSPSPIVQKMFPDLRTTSSRRMYPNAYISSTKTGSSTRGCTCVGTRFPPRYSPLDVSDRRLFSYAFSTQGDSLRFISCCDDAFQKGIGPESGLHFFHNSVCFSLPNIHWSIWNLLFDTC